MCARLSLRLAVSLSLIVSQCSVVESAVDDESGSGERRKVLTRFLERFDQIHAAGWTRTQRSSDTGVGYTLESLLGLTENNSPRGDFEGMEVKAFRKDEDGGDDHEKMNLFLKEPEWIDGLAGAERVEEYGYRDENSRQAWYLSVTNTVNDAALQLVVSPARDSIEFRRNEAVIARWTTEVIEKRLQEKLNHAVYVGASARGEGRDEEFRYESVLWCHAPSAERLLTLVESGDIIVELRMHLREDCSLRNHGTAFRVRKQKLKTLFAEQELVRSKADSDDAP